MFALMIGLLGIINSTAAHAHDTPIALLRLKETTPGNWIERWTYSSALALEPPTPVYPEHCVRNEPQVVCGETGLVGPLTFEKLGDAYSAAVVRLIPLDGQRSSFTLTAASPGINLTPGGVLPISAVAASYVPLGFEHILLGIDHLLFVLGLLLLVRTPIMLFRTITAFTVAHSITLAAATFGWLGVPENSVNALIALSIVFVAIEVIKLRRGEIGFSVRYPWAIAFGFGLLHGFGFAGALTSIGLPPANLPAALLFFNVGVEIGQLLFVAVVLGLIWAHRQLEAMLPRWSSVLAAYGMGAVATFWFVSRMSDMVAPLSGT